MARRRIKIRVQRRVNVRVRRQITRKARVRRVPPSAGSRAISPPSSSRSAASPRPLLRTGISPVAEVGENLREVIGDDPRNFDVFLCHAGPDKDDFVRPLASALREGGLKVWYDEFELRVGDSLRRGIDKGIRAARFGLVILSGAFLKGRSWAEHELDGIVNAYIYNRQVLLPIWHGVTHSDVLEYSPSLADKVALSSDDMSVNEIAHEIISYIRSSNHNAS